ncbi:hypothetical protein PVAND_002063 [Polypedilum vanderplanki]|uniref:Uncharacterized protein n=1 Tax=Polypedilum vanderplanki TaxID=319348 RepID=A0A9J6BR89_POLVA|nr:hypothetical protein PVAND_002063 [Polypedilum vanderplanki]
MKSTISKLFTSLGCILASALLIMCYLVVLGGAFDPGIDLLKGLNLQANLSQYEGISITQGTQKKIAFKLQGTNRKLILPHKTYERAVELLKKNSDFTLAATLKQEERNPGTIISFSSGYNRYFELQSSGRRNEIRFHYSYIGPKNELMVHMESFPYRLADNKWHKIAVSISGTEIQLIIDCHPLYKRVMHSVPDRNFSASNMQLLVGQRNLNGHSLFKGELQDVRLLPGPYGYLLQCEHMDSQCPTCGQFLQLQSFIMELQQNLSQLNQKLDDSIKKIKRLETCDCKKSCHMNGSISREDGEKWEKGCDQCQCKEGIVKCYKKPCPETKCKNPVLKEGECCPKCLKPCFKEIEYEHGDEHISGCNNCTCNDGNIICGLITCPALSCSEDEQISVAGECCKYCKDVDYCALGHNCNDNAKCFNLNTSYTCKCNKGFQGDGYHCTDVNECLERGGENGHHCNSYTQCVNNYGSYDCQCLSGFSYVDKWNCAEIDECETGNHSCNENAQCKNTIGSYSCECKSGYSGSGFECVPICESPCLNGGECIAPNECECRAGYEGSSCEKDLDECKTADHGCPSTSVCVNMPGWYYCKCKPGYEMKDNNCVDINECEEGTHSCHESAKCVNTEGHFECKCDNNMKSSYNLVKSRQTTIHDCKLSCMFENNEIEDQKQITPRNQPCITCTCSKGVISCEEPTCDCSKWRRSEDRDLCCPQCDPNESCQHQELKHVTFKSGEQWIYQCQTCECLYGEFDCWKMDCPPLFCENPLPPEPGDCCRRCPNDSCGFNNSTIATANAIGKPCFFEKHPDELQQQQLQSKDCTTCSTCKVPYCAQLQVSNTSCFVHR